MNQAKRIKICVFVIFVIITVVYIAFPYQAASLQGSSENDIDSYISSKMDELRLPGLSLGIINGEEIYLKGYGEADSSGTKMSAQTPFLLGSTTKSITALAVMQLSEQGKIDLDEKVVAYLPDFSFDEKRESDSITIRQLLYQVSGIAGPTGDSDYLDAESTGQDFIARLKNETLTDTPGGSYQYAEANFIILGEVISAVSGQSYESYIQENIFTPLKMNNSFTNENDAAANGLADGYITWFGFPVKTDLPYPKQYTSASALYSSAEDLTHYMSCILSGGVFENQTVVSKGGLDEILAPAVPLLHPTGYSYGMGWFVNENYVIHDGRPTNYYSVVLLNPERKAGVVLLANANNRLVTAEYLMPVSFEIMSILNGEAASPSGFGFRQLYKIANGILLWIFLILGYRILKTIFILPKKRIRDKHRGLVYLKTIIADVIIVLALVLLLLYLLSSYGVGLKIAYLGQPDVVFSFGVFILLGCINIAAKTVLVLSKQNTLGGRYRTR